MGVDDQGAIGWVWKGCRGTFPVYVGGTWLLAWLDLIIVIV